MKAPSPLAPHLLYKGPLGYEPVYLTDIIRLMACNKQTYVYTIHDESPLIFPESMTSYMSLLTPNFFCSHRSHIANLSYLVNYNNKERKLFLCFGHEVPVSENSASDLLQILMPEKQKKNYRIGTLFFRCGSLFFRIRSFLKRIYRPVPF
ncbi:MAG TPA: LytTR family DNA-binding domain-containing protein [Bacteroidales bacterium]